MEILVTYARKILSAWFVIPNVMLPSPSAFVPILTMTTMAILQTVVCANQVRKDIIMSLFLYMYHYVHVKLVPSLFTVTKLIAMSCYGYLNTNFGNFYFYE